MTGGWYTGGVYGMLNRGAGVADYSFTKGGTKEAAMVVLQGGPSVQSGLVQVLVQVMGRSYGYHYSVSRRLYLVLPVIRRYWTHSFMHA